MIYDRVSIRRPAGVVCEHGSLRDRLLPARIRLLRHLWAVPTRRACLHARYERNVLNNHCLQRPIFIETRKNHTFFSGHLLIIFTAQYSPLSLILHGPKKYNPLCVRCFTFKSPCLNLLSSTCV